MKGLSNFSLSSLLVRSTMVALLLCFKFVPVASADFGDKHVHLYISLGWRSITSVPVKDEMIKLDYNQIGESRSLLIGSATLLYSLNPKFSIGVEGWWTESNTFRGYKTLPLVLYAYFDESMDTTTYVMDMEESRYLDVGVLGPAFQWTLTSRESKQMYIRGMAGISFYSSGVNRFARWSSGSNPLNSILALDSDHRHDGAYGAGLTLGGNFHTRWISLGLEAGLRYSSPKTIRIPYRRADTILAGGFLVKPEEGGINLPEEKRELSFLGISIGIVLGIHAF